MQNGNSSYYMTLSSSRDLYVYIIYEHSKTTKKPQASFFICIVKMLSSTFLATPTFWIKIQKLKPVKIVSNIQDPQSHLGFWKLTAYSELTYLGQFNLLSGITELKNDTLQAVSYVYF